jgi:hypothetical protein
MRKRLEKMVTAGRQPMTSSTGDLRVPSDSPLNTSSYSPLETSETKLYSTCHYLLKAAQHSLRNILEIVKTKLIDYSKVMPI